MTTTPTDHPLRLVSATATARILATPHLAQRLLPEGLVRSPYAVLDFDATLTLHDARGMRATFARTQQVRFCQEGVSAILDHTWGDGIALTDYRTDAGALVGAIRDGARRHLMLALPRRMHRDEEFTIRIRRTAMATFLAQEEWLETVVDHPIAQLHRTIVFPPERPCRVAVLEDGTSATQLPVQHGQDGQTSVAIEVPRPVAHQPYRIRWAW